MEPFGLYENWNGVNTNKADKVPGNGSGPGPTRLGNGNPEVDVFQGKVKVEDLRKNFEVQNVSRSNGIFARKNRKPEPESASFSTKSPEKVPLSRSKKESNLGFANGSGQQKPATRNSPEDWDFLAKLNDILKNENFWQGEEDKVLSAMRNITGTGLGFPDPNIAATSVPTQPPATRPPRPARRSDRRKAEFLKARSMDVGDAIRNLEDFSNPPPLGPPRCVSPYLNLTGNYEYDLPKNGKNRPNDLNLDNSSSLKNVTSSSSLDSIYDKLRSYAEFSENRQAGSGSPHPHNPQPRSYPFPPYPYMSCYSNYPGFSGSGTNLNYAGTGGAGFGHWPQQYHQCQQQQQSLGGSRNNLNGAGASASGGVPLPMPVLSNPWFAPTPPGSNFCRYGSQGSLKGSLLGLDYEDRLLRLESDKESLHLQVSVLSDQIDAQTSKIHDLEKLLDDKRNVLESTEDTLQRELLTRSSLETQKLELLTEISSLRLKHASLERENFELKDRIVGNSLVDLNYGGGNSISNGDGRIWDKPPLGPYRSSSPHGNNLGQESAANFLVQLQQQQQQRERGRLGSNSSDSAVGSPQKSRPKTPPATAYRRVEQQSSFGTLPRRTPSSQLSAWIGPGEVTNNKNASLSSGNIHSIVHFQNGPNGNNGNGGNNGGGSTAIERDDWERKNSKKLSPGGHKSRGILRILGKLKRSNSGGRVDDVSPGGGGGGRQDLQQQQPQPFARGGLRSTTTAVPRLGWMNDMSSVQKPSGPIQSWDSNNVVQWLSFIGLGIYSNEIRRWVKTGQQLLDASSHELEKELGIKNQLHLKKLNLALYYLKNPNVKDESGQLDHNWVIHWLDDIGLPQYKEKFNEAKVDGHVLNHLTVDDLFLLKINNLLHHVSICRGIQLLRIHAFHPGCLCRRSDTLMQINAGDLKGPRNVSTWTNHRVMEWLKSIDLAEYAPNLRGSGVHGALIIFESKFNAELLSTLLSIPSNKTLLRRHLSLQVNELVGNSIVKEKRLVELGADFIPISPTFKTKQAKPKVFKLKSKKASQIDFNNEELLCPLDWNIFPFPTDEDSESGRNNFASLENEEIKNGN